MEVEEELVLAAHQQGERELEQVWEEWGVEQVWEVKLEVGQV